MVKVFAPHEIGDSGGQVFDLGSGSKTLADFRKFQTLCVHI